MYSGLTSNKFESVHSEKWLVEEVFIVGRYVDASENMFFFVWFWFFQRGCERD